MNNRLIITIKAYDTSSAFEEGGKPTETKDVSNRQEFDAAYQTFISKGLCYFHFFSGVIELRGKSAARFLLPESTPVAAVS